MNRTSGRRTLHAAIFAALLTIALPIAHADQWTTPTPEELSMTSQPEIPGAAAVYLYREESTNGGLSELTIYARVKVLTEAGKKYGDIEITYGSRNDETEYKVEDIEARTIHPDGTIVPYTGQPYDKLIDKTKDDQRTAKIFSLPDISVGSILEYRYKVQYNRYLAISPYWYVQSKLYTRKAHFHWVASSAYLTDTSTGRDINTIAWTPILPPGVEVQQSKSKGDSTSYAGQTVFDLDMHDIPPVPDEDHMPPIASLSYRVLFYYSSYKTGDQYWKEMGKSWASAEDKFIGPGHSVKDAVKDLTIPTDTQDQKLRKLYAAIMQLENTDFTREHSTSEEKAEGFKKIHTTDDILKRKHGSSDQLAELFVAMARAAGMKAYVAAVTNRDSHLFIPDYLNLGQFDDYIAIVNIDGKEQYFDPGSRYCSYGHLAWKHTMGAALRQTDKGAEIVAATPSESFKDSSVVRIADLTLDPTGLATGTVKMTFTGAPALRWRQHFLTGDSVSLNNELRENLEQLMPGGTEVKVGSIEKLEDYEQPLIVNFTVKGGIGSFAGKRLILPADVFETNAKPTFSHEKREIPVYFNYPYMAQDAVRIKFPASFNIESLPVADKVQLQNQAVYAMSAVTSSNSFTVHRNYLLGDIIFSVTEYPDLRSFYSKMETKDQESVVLTTAPVTAKPSPAAN